MASSYACIASLAILGGALGLIVPSEKFDKRTDRWYILGRLILICHAVLAALLAITVLEGPGQMLVEVSVCAVCSLWIADNVVFLLLQKRRAEGCMGWPKSSIQFSLQSLLWIILSTGSYIALLILLFSDPP
ncbi:MAG: hypothetical protein M5U26_21530 [Planctomycetota bacterium]|nr:hypothetical protein [Planctomycetota bacterium]